MAIVYNHISMRYPMKKIILPVLVLLLTGAACFAQGDTRGNRTIPAVTVKTMDGQSFNTADLSNDNNPMIISFWAL